MRARRLSARSVMAPSTASRRRSARTPHRKAPAQRSDRPAVPAVRSSPERGGPDCELSPAAELDELLDGSSLWWEEAGPEGAPLADLLQQIVGFVDGPDGLQAETGYGNMAADCTASASVDSDKMAPAATFPRNRGRCQGNKNALAARLNRLRKKEYVSGLESSVARLTGENQQLQRERQALGARVRELEQEARYLRAVLANDSSLSQLLGRLTGLGGVRLSTSLFLDPTTSAGDHDYALPGFRQDLEQAREAGEGAHPCGVCLHVDREKVSVEFCASCARKAVSASKM
ncbi:CREB ATF bZIP transcription factor [Pelobates cultripes]|uniref:CREB ATF bZIP transcription factor n=1 Tax=Pelobates cultripes TaxID=61616 RepID=A0AAD1R8U1_PELCU|nr:CREB ATF bZIP transcription factor [Pelobates cultripes]